MNRPEWAESRTAEEDAYLIPVHIGDTPEMIATKLAINSARQHRVLKALSEAQEREQNPSISR